MNEALVVLVLLSVAVSLVALLRKPEDTNGALVASLLDHVMQANAANFDLAQGFADKIMAFSAEGREYQRVAAEVNALQAELASTKERMLNHTSNGTLRTAAPEVVVPETQRWSDTTPPPGGM